MPRSGSSNGGQVRSSDEALHVACVQQGIGLEQRVIASTSRCKACRTKPVNSAARPAGISPAVVWATSNLR